MATMIVLRKWRKVARSDARRYITPTSPDARFWNRLYRNNKDGTIYGCYGKSRLARFFVRMGVATGDYDNDGNTDTARL